VVEDHDLVALDAGVQLGELLQAQHGEAGQQGEQPDVLEGGAGGEEVGGVDVDPHRRLGDLAAGRGQLVRHRLPQALQRDPAAAGRGLRDDPAGQFPLHVVAADDPVRPGTRERADVDPVVPRQLPDQR
jgi:hypothetical protein